MQLLTEKDLMLDTLRIEAHSPLEFGRSISTSACRLVVVRRRILLIVFLLANFRTCFERGTGSSRLSLNVKRSRFQHLFYLFESEKTLAYEKYTTWRHRAHKSSPYKPTPSELRIVIIRHHGESKSVLPAGGSHQAVPPGTAASHITEPRAYLARWTHISVARFVKRRAREHRKGASTVGRSRRFSVSNPILSSKAELTGPSVHLIPFKKQKTTFGHSTMI